jgi:hypothetical protein
MPAIIIPRRSNKPQVVTPSGPPTTNRQIWVKSDTQVWQDDARTTAAVADGATVQAWSDQSGNSYHLTRPASVNLTYKTNQINGLPCVRGGTANFAGLTTGNIVALNSLPWHVFIVAKITTFAAYKLLVDGGNTPFTTAFYTHDASPKVAISANGTTNELIDTTHVSVGTWFIAELLFNGASSRLKINNETAVTGNAGSASTPNGMALFCGANGQYPISCDIAEVLGYNASLSGADVTTARDYLNSRYAIF